jgi:hypothetical protein
MLCNRSRQHSHVDWEGQSPRPPLAGKGCLNMRYFEVLPMRNKMRRAESIYPKMPLLQLELTMA